MRVAREASAAVLSALVLLLYALLMRSVVVVLVSSIILVFLLIFFRDPERVPEGDGILSPADGKVTRVHDGTISIFMSLTDVHVNRSPVDGWVVSVKHTDGKHVPAWMSGASENEKNEIRIKSDAGTFTVVQIAGTLARRIRCFVKPGDMVHRGQRIGIIFLGSRVDVALPPHAKIYVREGDRVKSGETVIAGFDGERPP